MNTFIPLSVPNFTGNEEKYVLDAVRSEWVSTGGAYINIFEKNIAEYLNVKGAVACQSGTAGLHLALILSGVTAQDEVIVPTLTFIAAVNPVKYLGSQPIFMDCDDNLTIDVHKLRSFCENNCEIRGAQLINKNTNKIIKALVVVHVFGNMANMEEIMNIAQTYHLKVVEDATEALGTYYTKGDLKGYYAGTVGDYGVFSFNGNKIITTGGGGMLVAKKKEDLEKAKYLSTQAKDDELYYMHNEIGYNYRMTNIQAALGVAQLERLEDYIQVKQENYLYYKEHLKDIKGIRLLPFSESIRSNYWFYALCIDFEDLAITQNKLIKALEAEKIQTRPIWGLIHNQKPYQQNEAVEIVKASYYHDHVVNIPCSSSLTKNQIDRVIEVLKKLLEA